MGDLPAMTSDSFKMVSQSYWNGQGIVRTSPGGASSTKEDTHSTLSDISVCWRGILVCGMGV